MQGSLAISAAQREKRILNGIIQNLLPVVGPSVKSIVLAYSSTVSSKMVLHKIYFNLVITELPVAKYATKSELLSSFLGAPDPRSLPQYHSSRPDPDWCDRFCIWQVNKLDD